MIISTRELLETSVAQLSTLAAFLGDQLAEDLQGSLSPPATELRACKELLRTLAALIPKVEAACKVTPERRAGDRAL